MEPLDLAKKYMSAFFGDEPLDSLQELFSSELKFSGPFYKFDKAKDYIDSLKKDPIKNASYMMVAEYQDKDSACLVYEFTKSNISTTMAQWFQVKNEKITKIKLVFDSRAFTLQGTQIIRVK